MLKSESIDFSEESCHIGPDLEARKKRRSHRGGITIEEKSFGEQLEDRLKENFLYEPCLALAFIVNRIRDTRLPLHQVMKEVVEKYGQATADEAAKIIRTGAI